MYCAIQEKGLSGSTKYAVEKLMVTVGRAREIPQYMEMQLMTKARSHTASNLTESFFVSDSGPQAASEPKQMHAEHQ